MSSTAPVRQVRVGRVRPVDPQGPAQGLPADQAADRGRRGPGDRRWHRDPAGHRHPGRRRVRAVRRRRGRSWSLYPLGGSAVRLPRQIPYTVAADLLLTGRPIQAPEAKELGLIGHVVPDGEALAKAHELADLIAANGPLAVQAILKTMRDSEGKHEDDCWKADATVGAAVFESEDAKEGPRAFPEKRPPSSRVADLEGYRPPDLLRSPPRATALLVVAEQIRGSGSADAALALPELGAQGLLVRLAQRGQGQGVRDDDLLR